MSNKGSSKLFWPAMLRKLRWSYSHPDNFFAVFLISFPHLFFVTVGTYLTCSPLVLPLLHVMHFPPRQLWFRHPLSVPRTPSQIRSLPLNLRHSSAQQRTLWSHSQLTTPPEHVFQLRRHHPIQEMPNHRKAV